MRTVGDGVTAAMVKKYISDHAEKGLAPAQGELFPKTVTKRKKS